VLAQIVRVNRVPELLLPVALRRRRRRTVPRHLCARCRLSSVGLCDRRCGQRKNKKRGQQHPQGGDDQVRASWHWLALASLKRPPQQTSHSSEQPSIIARTFFPRGSSRACRRATSAREICPILAPKGRHKKASDVSSGEGNCNRLSP